MATILLTPNSAPQATFKLWNWITTFFQAEKAKEEAEKEMRQRDEDEQIRMENILSGTEVLSLKLDTPLADQGVAAA